MNVSLTPYLPVLMGGENLLIACCYFAIGSGISYGIWRNRQAGIDALVVVVAGIFFSCALGHTLHSIGMWGFPHIMTWQVVIDLTTVIVAIRFLSFYRSFDLLAQFSQIYLAKIELERKNQELEITMAELQQAQTQLIQSEKMSSLGQLVAGVAHEINNPVNFIHGNLIHLQESTQDLLDLTQLYQKYYPNPEPEIQDCTDEIDLEFLKQDLPEILKSMKFGTNRIREIVLSLRNFSRMDEADLKMVDIHEGIESALVILQYRLKDTSPTIQVVKDYGELPLVECYPGQLNQVFINILTNAIDAIEDGSAKRKSKETEDHLSQIVLRTSVVDSNWVQISIADNGTGMSEQVQQQILNPFFTTKPVGKGTGMGMSISYKIITERHQGKLICFSKLGEGTEFLIQIPIQNQQSFKTDTLQVQER
ncbi:MAG: sensor histidine kinase [Microcoleaceae cyanobacterium]